MRETITEADIEDRYATFEARMRALFLKTVDDAINGLCMRLENPILMYVPPSNPGAAGVIVRHSNTLTMPEGAVLPPDVKIGMVGSEARSEPYDGSSGEGAEAPTFDEANITRV